MTQQTGPIDHTEPARAPLPRQMPAIARAAGIVALYVIGWLRLDRATQVFEVSPGITAWYPVPALSLALLLIFGLRYAPALLIGPLLTALWLHPLPIPLAPLYALIIALILALFYGAAAAALRCWVRIDLQLRQLRDVAWFVAVAIIAAPLAVALCAVAGFAAAGLLPWPQYLSGVVSFWADDAIGILTLTAEDGRTAIEVFSAHAAEIAVVVLDLTMPGIDGRATFHVLREISDVPVIFSSGQSAAELAGQLEAPDTTFVAKPYNLADLTQAVAQMAQSSRKPA